MKRIFLLLFVTCSTHAEPLKVIFFDYGGVMANVDRTPLLHFIAKTSGTTYETVKKDFARDRLYFSLAMPKSFWESYGSCKLTDNWIEELESKKRASVSPISGMEELVTSLKKAGFHVALLSNTEKARSVFLKEMGGYDIFSDVILSCDVKAQKPNTRIFSIALKKLAVEPTECLFIDDKERNVKAAKKMGMDGIVFRSAKELKAELLKRGVTF